jgi:hypothetical protein
MIAPLPDIREPVGCIVWGFVAQLYVGEDPRFKEEGVGIKSEPRARQEMGPCGER